MRISLLRGGEWNRIAGAMVSYTLIHWTISKQWSRMRQWVRSNVWEFVLWQRVGDIVKRDTNNCSSNIVTTGDIPREIYVKKNAPSATLCSNFSNRHVPRTRAAKQGQPTSKQNNNVRVLILTVAVLPRTAHHHARTIRTTLLQTWRNLPWTGWNA